MTVGSLAYRRSVDEIWNGRVPDKYRRILPFIPSSGRHVMEIGAAEGVLSLLLAANDPASRITALELRSERHEAAIALQERWRAIGRHVDGCTMVCADIRQHLYLLKDVDTLVAVRTLYHLREGIDDVLAEAANYVTAVVLVGNPNRARRYVEAKGSPDDALGRFNFYAGVDGMRIALEKAGFTIGQIVTEGDPIVTGHR